MMTHRDDRAFSAEGLESAGLVKLWMPDRFVSSDVRDGSFLLFSASEARALAERC